MEIALLTVCLKKNKTVMLEICLDCPFCTNKEEIEKIAQIHLNCNHGVERGMKL